MPVFDFPLEQLKTYQGQNPRPADFDAYWEKALKELGSASLKIELSAVDLGEPGTEAFDLYFKGVGGARVHAKYLRPKGSSGKAPAIVEYHGYSGNSGDFTDKLKWVKLGYSVFSLDCRGQGGLSEDVGIPVLNSLRGHIIRGIETPETFMFRFIYLDCVQLIRIAMEQPGVDPTRIGVTGGSQGGGLSVAAAALEPRVARCASCFPFLSDYRRVWDLNTSGAYEEIKDWFRRFDPLHQREVEIFTRLGYLDIQNLAPRIKGKVLMSVGLTDQTCPPSTVYACFNKIKVEKEMMVYPDFGHEGLPGWNDAVFKFLAAMR